MSTTSQYPNPTSNSRLNDTYTKLSTADERGLIKPPSEDPNFIATFFTHSDVPNVEDVDGSIGKLLQDVCSASEELDMYSPLTSLFNELSDRLSTHLNETAYSSVLHFVPSYKTSPAGKGYQYTRRLAPDILVVPPIDRLREFLPKEISADGDKLFPRCPWPLLESIVEVKDKKERDVYQCLDYLETILQHRPDKSSALGMGCNQQFYYFYYMDACTATCSVPFYWSDGLRNLLHFINTLNYSYAKDLGHDPSMKLHKLQWEGINVTPYWHISHTETYEMQPMFERKGLGRRTWLGIGTIWPCPKNDNASRSTIRVVKDMWRDNSRRFEEGEILNMIHKKGFLPGVVRHAFAGPVHDLTIGSPSKRRVMLGSIGLRLSACQSVLEFLKVMFDAVETHEQIVNQGVLHRDISWFNLLCKPQHYVHGPTVAVPTIGKILGDQDENSTCLLTDFDNAGLLTADVDHEANTERTGTPMFMALELAYGGYGYKQLRATAKKNPITLDQFTLEGETLDRYVKAYGKERYDVFNANVSAVVSGTVKEIPPFATDSITPHRPHHDIESVWWIVLWFLLRSCPTFPITATINEAEEKLRVQQSEHLERILLRRSVDGICSDIVTLLANSAESWEMILHPAYHSLSAMLADMGQYICMCWSRFPEVPFWHAHEAFKRLLLKEIIRLTNEGTPLPIQGSLARLSFPSRPSHKRVSTLNSNASRSKHPPVGSSPCNSDLSSQTSSSKKRPRSDSEASGSEGAARRIRRVRETSDQGNNVVIENLKNDDKWFL